MTKQKGQSIIEFALIAPIFFFMCFFMIYMGMLFMDYLQFSNAARTAARDIAIASTAEERTKIIDELKDADNDQHQNRVSRYANQLTKLYDPTFDVNDEGDSVTVSINLKLAVDLKILPEELKPIKYVMKKEEATL